MTYQRPGPPDPQRPAESGQVPPGQIQPGQFTPAQPPAYPGQGDGGQGYSQPYPSMPPPPAPPMIDAPPPRVLRPVVALLLTNLALSVLLTVAVLLARHSIINYQLDHRHITDPDERTTLRDSYSAAIVIRAVGNVVVSIVYVFLVRALLRGRRWAYRRVIWLGGVGIVSLGFLLFTPYPWWMHAEQVVQALVLATLVYCVTRPEVRAYFAEHLPGRTTRRFRA